MWFLVSYNRAKQCGDVVQSLIECGISTPGRLIVQGLEQEDAYRRIRLPKDWRCVVLPQNIGLCGALQKCFRDYPSEPCYSVLADDEFVHTPGFDVRIMEAAGRWGIAHGNDGWRTEKGWYHTLATHGGDLVREVGWWALPGLWHNYFDNAWQHIGAEFGLRRYCRDIKTTHFNPDVDLDDGVGGTAEWDDTYRTGRGRAEIDKALFESWKIIEYPQLRQRLRSAMRRKNFLNNPY